MDSDSTTITALSRVLAHFSLKELKDVVVPVFEGKLTFKDALKIISSEMLTLSAVSLRAVILDTMREEHRRYVQDKIFYLKLLDVAVHERRNWSSWKLLDETDCGDFWIEENLLQQKIQHSFTLQNLFGLFHVIMHGGIFWIMICIKLANMERGIKYHPPLYCAFVPGDVYLFTLGTAPKDVFKCLTKSVLGYNRVKHCLLTGRSVSSLFRLLKKKEQKANSWRDVDEQYLHRNLSSVHVVESENGFNLTQKKKRETYAKNIIGDDPPVLESYVIKASDNKWKGGSEVSHFVGKDFETVITLKSKNISHTVEKLIVNGLISTPAPPHFENLNCLGSNDLQLQHDGSASEDEDDSD